MILTLKILKICGGNVLKPSRNPKNPKNPNQKLQENVNMYLLKVIKKELPVHQRLKTGIFVLNIKGKHRVMQRKSLLKRPDLYNQ